MSAVPDFARMASSLTSPEAFLALTDEPGVFGAKKQAKVAYDLWTGSSTRYVGEYRAFHAPGGTGTGLIVRTFWDPTQVSPDIAAMAATVASGIPASLIRADEKETYRARDKKQAVFFTWQGMRGRALSQLFTERFGVGACASQLFARSDLTQNTAVVVEAGGVDHLWTLTLPA